MGKSQSQERHLDARISRSFHVRLVVFTFFLFCFVLFCFFFLFFFSPFFRFVIFPVERPKLIPYDRFFNLVWPLPVLELDCATHNCGVLQISYENGLTSLQEWAMGSSLTFLSTPNLDEATGVYLWGCGAPRMFVELQYPSVGVFNVSFSTFPVQRFTYVAGSSVLIELKKGVMNVIEIDVEMGVNTAVVFPKVVPFSVDMSWQCTFQQDEGTNNNGFGHMTNSW